MPATVQRTRPSGSLLGRRQESLTLRVCNSQHDGREIRLRSPKCTIGSAPGCTLRLKAPGVQPLHCWIITGQGGTVVRRQHANTLLNGGAFDDAPLAPGDRLQVGPIQLEVVACAVGWPEEDWAQALAEEQAHRARVEVVRLQTALGTVEHQAAQRLGEITELVNRLTGERDSAQDQLRTSQQQFSEFETRWVEKSACDRAALVRTESELRRIQHEAEERVAEVTRSLEQAASQRDALQVQLVVFQEQLAEGRQQADVSTTAAVDRLGLAAAEIAELRLRLADVEGQLNQANSNLVAGGEAEARLRELEQALAATLAERNALQGQLDRVNNEPARENASTGEHSCQVTDFDQERRELASERAAFEVERERQSAELTHRLNEVLARQAEFEHTHARFEERQEELRQQLEDLRSERYAFDQQRIAMAEELARHEQDAQSRQERLDQQAVEIEAERHALAQQREAQEAKLATYQPPDSINPLVPEACSSADLDAGSTCAVSDANYEDSQDSLECTRRAGEPDRFAEESQPAVAWKDVSATPKPVWPQKPAPQADDDSIESYMERLMQRVRGSDNTPPTQTSVKPTFGAPAAPAAEKSVESPKPVAAPAVVPEPVQPGEYVPRSAAPEQGVNLAAMRELANTAARSAIKTHAKRRGLERALAKAIGLGVTLVLSLVLTYWAVGQGLWLAAGAAFAGFVVSTVWGFQALRHVRGEIKASGSSGEKPGVTVAADSLPTVAETNGAPRTE